ncbi:exodeoxyribonuclease V subunit gamma [Sodalis sp. CWE]|uniref:exodeoxyribonuclease V subunit gamma n=1 Tax=Sodalis sp. CWE TaxID=2803816 RepID=UPI001C7D39B0|nr:exodeoxyribonuclease V subunit gamma [Sodalis sp. CWE]MBX4180884.1 exodeoxyribonuclease V subunit gamma [Sodalis sp. CWE]
MFTVYHSNRLDVLKSIMGSQIINCPLENPFQPEIVLVHGNLMAKWLQIELAKEFKIAANINFLLPSNFIWQMLSRLYPDAPNLNDSFIKSVMVWKLMTLLPSLSKHPDFELIRKYLHSDKNQRKSFQLSKNIADLFNQYLIYRPDWLEAWEKGKLVDEINETQKWQAMVWKALVENTERKEGFLWHQKNPYQHFFKTLMQSQTLSIGLPTRIFIFGISTLPPTYLQMLQSMSHHIDIYFLFANPCSYYWETIYNQTFPAQFLSPFRKRHYQESITITRNLFQHSKKTELSFDKKLRGKKVANPLLMSCGKQGGDLLLLLEKIDKILNIDAFTKKKVKKRKKNLLNVLQNNILMLEDQSDDAKNSKIKNQNERKYSFQKKDRSISLHSCHSQHREIEILHNNLLAMMTEDPTLRLRDIIVMAPDINRYIPSITTIFGGNINKEYRLPFSILKNRTQYLHPILITFLNLLKLPKSRFFSEQIFELLEVPALANCFSIDKEGIRLLRKWVEESGIRWGLDDNTLHAFHLPVTFCRHTWQHGLTRMLLGYAMDSDNGDWRNIFPYKESSGLVANLAGQLAEFLKKLKKWRDYLAISHSLDDWLNCAKQIIEDFFRPNSKEKEILKFLERKWKQIIIYGLKSKYTQSVSLAILQDELTSSLEEVEQGNQDFMAESIIFCTLMPEICSIPFRVICLLGMNSGIYPRTQPALEFDLMKQKPRCGDHNLRDEDRYLFLKVLISAQSYLYISFIDQNTRNNSHCYPSTLVSELSNYIAQNFYFYEDNFYINTTENQFYRAPYLYQKHSRMPFAKENFLPNSECQSFASEWLAAANGSGKPQKNFFVPLKTQLSQNSTFSLDDLLFFYRHPIRAWFKKRLKITFHKKAYKLSESEPFTIDNLTKYKINNWLINSLVNGENSADLFRKACGTGLIPYGVFGELFWAEQFQNIEKLATQVRFWKSIKTFNLEVDLLLDDIRISGWLTTVHTNGLLRWKPGTLSAKDGLLLWLEHLIYCALGNQGESKMLGIRGEWCFAPLSVSQAKIFLTSLVTGYFKGVKDPLLLLPRSGGEWLTHCFDRTIRNIDWSKSCQKRANDALIKTWKGSFFTTGENKDPYIQRLIPHLDQKHIQNIISIAKQYFLPPFIFNLAENFFYKK